jgi:hypothetical protein
MDIPVSLREQVMQEVFLLLNANGSPALNIYREQLDEIDAASCPAYDLALDEESVSDGEEAAHGEVKRSVKLKVRCINVITSAGSAVVDPLYVFAVQQILKDDTLGGLIYQVKETGSRFVYRPGGKDVIGLEIDFEAIITTVRDDPAQTA